MGGREREEGMNIRRAGDSREQRERRSIHRHSGDTAGNGDREIGLQASAAGPGAWDPYEVWLTRVKQPREAIERERTRSLRRRPSQGVTADDSPSGLHPILHR